MTFTSRRIVLVAGLALFCSGGTLFCQGSKQKLVGGWYYRDGGGILEYSFSSGGTYSAVKQMTAPGYPRLVIRINGNYEVRGTSVTLQPTEATANNNQSPLVRESGQYDADRDKLILRQENSTGEIVYSRK